VHFLRDVRAKTRLGAQRQRLFAQTGAQAGAVNHKGLIAQIVETQTGPRGQGVVGMEGGQQGLALHHQGGQAGVVHQLSGADETQIEAVREQVVDLRLRRLLAQIERDLRPGGAKVAQQPGHHIGEGHRAGKAHGQPAGLAAADLPGLRNGVFHRVENAPRQRQQGVAGGRALHSTAPTGEQGHAELGFQRLDLLAQRRLRDVQALRGSGEVALFGHGDEVAQMAQVHIENRSEF